MGIGKPKPPCIVNPAIKAKRSMRIPLPPCEGPKLARFPNSHRPVEFLSLISEPEDSAHSHVFKVKIAGEIYALKMFHFYDPFADFFSLNNEQRDHLRYGDLFYHMDPFFVECRAYGRINADKPPGSADTAVHGLGYLSLPATLEDKLKKYGAHEWNRADKEYDQPVSRRIPFRAIVKKFASESNVWDVPNSKRALQDIKKLRRMGIYNMDIKASNYAGNKLVDFSLSNTEPSLLLSTVPSHQEEYMRELDLSMFDDMMEEENVKNAPRAFRNLEYCRKLRPRRNDKVRR